MKNLNITIWIFLLILSLLNYDYAKISPFEVSKSNILDILIILCCIGAIIFNRTQGTKKYSE